MTVDVLDLSGSLAFVDEMYAQFRADPTSVDPSWAAMFGAAGATPSNGHAPSASRSIGGETLIPHLARCAAARARARRRPSSSA
jgi:2-oxoglutarate dehydrogenase complex dehydrogenase (E1) component-like enzyme